MSPSISRQTVEKNKQISNIQDHSKAPEFTTLGKFAATPNGQNPRPITKLTFNEYFPSALQPVVLKDFSQS